METIYLEKWLLIVPIRCTKSANATDHFPLNIYPILCYPVIPRLICPWPLWAATASPAASPRLHRGAVALARQRDRFVHRAPWHGPTYTRIWQPMRHDRRCLAGSHPGRRRFQSSWGLGRRCCPCRRRRAAWWSSDHLQTKRSWYVKRVWHNPKQESLANAEMWIQEESGATGKCLWMILMHWEFVMLDATCHKHNDVVWNSKTIAILV